MRVTRRPAEDSISRARLFELLNYEPETGEFCWRISKSNVPAGSPAGHVGKFYGYRTIKIDRRQYRASRLAFFYMTGVWPKYLIDHINGDRLDDRFCNLREATPQQNAINSRRPNKTGFRGVSRHSENPSKFIATIRLAGKSRYLGSFDTAEQAAEAYRRAAIRNFGEFAVI